MKAKILKGMGKEFAKDIGYVVGQAAMKGIGYPIFGALSHNLKSRLEDKLGDKWFKSEDATIVNMLVNLVAYPAAAAIPTYHATHDVRTAIAIIGGFALALAEATFRNDYYSRAYPASLLGKMASLPFDYVTWLYDRAKRKVEEEK